jgi:hypothetical protein
MTDTPEEPTVDQLWDQTAKGTHSADALAGDTASQILAATGLPIAGLGLVGNMGAAFAMQAEEERREVALRALCPPGLWGTLQPELAYLAHHHTRLRVESGLAPAATPEGVPLTPRALAYIDAHDAIARGWRPADGPIFGYLDRAAFDAAAGCEPCRRCGHRKLAHEAMRRMWPLHWLHYRGRCHSWVPGPVETGCRCRRYRPDRRRYRYL